jgi:hypothetical protein
MLLSSFLQEDRLRLKKLYNKYAEPASRILSLLPFRAIIASNGVAYEL